MTDDDRWDGEPTTEQKLRWLAENGFFDDREAARLAAVLDSDDAVSRSPDATGEESSNAAGRRSQRTPPDGTAADRQPDTVTELRARVEELESELAATESRLQTKREEVDNYLERQEERLAERRKHATADLVERLLAEVYEPLGRALTTDERDTETLLDGIEMVREQFAATLAEDGVGILDPEPGTPLDRDRHAVERTVPAEHDDDTVCEVLEPGFTVDGEVVAKARVFVAE